MTYRARCEGRRRRYRFEKELRVPEGAELPSGTLLRRMSRPLRKGPTWHVRVLFSPGFYAMDTHVVIDGGSLVSFLGAAPYIDSDWPLPPSEFDGTVFLMRGGGIHVTGRSHLNCTSIGFCDSDDAIPLQRPVGTWFRAREAARTLSALKGERE